MYRVNDMLYKHLFLSHQKLSTAGSDTNTHMATTWFGYHRKILISGVYIQHN